MNIKHLVFVVFFLMGVFYNSEEVFVKMTNVECQSHNKSIAEIHYCRLKAISRNKTSLNINLTLIQPLYEATVGVQLLKRANGFKPFLYNFDFNGCDFMRRRNQPVAKMIYKLFKNQSSINHPCPYVGLQYLSDFHRIELPVVLPTGEYKLITRFTFYGEPQVTIRVSFMYKEEIWAKS